MLHVMGKPKPRGANAPPAHPERNPGVHYVNDGARQHTLLITGARQNPSQTG